MSGDSEHPVTLGDLRLSLFPGMSLPDTRPATVADLLSPEIRSLVIDGLRAEGVLVVEKVEGEWPEDVVERIADWATVPTNPVRRLLNRLAEAQPFPPAGGVS